MTFLRHRTASAFGVSAFIHVLLFVLYIRVVLLAPKTSTPLLGNVDFILKPKQAAVVRPSPTWDFLKLSLPKQSMLAVAEPKISPLLSKPISIPQRVPTVSTLSGEKAGRLEVKKSLDMNLGASANRLKLADSSFSMGSDRVQPAALAQGSPLDVEEVGARAVLVPQNTSLDGRGHAAAPLAVGNALSLDEETGASPLGKALAQATQPKTKKKLLDDFGLMSAGDYEMEGPLVNRKIIKKNVPKFPKWARGRNISEAVVSIKLYVTPSGEVMVDSLRVVRTSGYSDLDRYAMDALKEWKFDELSQDVEMQKQWGIITLRFEAD